MSYLPRLLCEFSKEPCNTREIFIKISCFLSMRSFLDESSQHPATKLYAKIVISSELKIETKNHFRIDKKAKMKNRIIDCYGLNTFQQARYVFIYTGFSLFFSLFFNGIFILYITTFSILFLSFASSAFIF